MCLAISEAIWLVLSSEVPSGNVNELCSSDWSSAGIQSRPTRRYKPNVERKVAMQIITRITRCASDQRSIIMYISSTECKNPSGFDFLLLVSTLKRRELIIGVSVKATRSETRIAIAIVQPNELTYFRAYPFMKAIGRKMMISDSVVAITARPISWVASMAAWTRLRPLSSMKRTMFSRTMIASSMTIPTASVSASRVMLLSEKSMARISVKVAIMELGMATAAIRTARQLRMKSQTIALAKMLPRIRCSIRE